MKKENAGEVSRIFTDLQVLGCNDTHSPSDKFCGCDTIYVNAILGRPLNETGMLLAGIQRGCSFNTHSRDLKEKEFRDQR
jgi:hypothetical protein